MKAIDFEFAPFEQVTIIDTETPAVVQACIANGTDKEYRIAFWVNGRREVEVVSADEIRRVGH